MLNTDWCFIKWIYVFYSVFCFFLSIVFTWLNRNQGDQNLFLSIFKASTYTLAALTTLFIIYSHTSPSNAVALDKIEAFKAYKYLNEFRANPKSYGNNLDLNLKYVKKRHPLKWNHTLAKVAEAKAHDMASNNYFSHRNKKGQGINIMIHKAGYKLPKEWTAVKSYNFFESICAGVWNGKDNINVLIEDEGEKSLSHRNHLLGINESKYHDINSKLVDIGIGIVHVNDGYSKYHTYCCVIIAKN
jgi:hypothetical protein